MFYVKIIGPYDFTVVGPFNSIIDAEDYRQTVPEFFDAASMGQLELDLDVGAADVQSPDTYVFDGQYANPIFR